MAHGTMELHFASLPGHGPWRFEEILLEYLQPAVSIDRARNEIPKLETRNEIDEIRNTKLQGSPTNLQDVVSNFSDIP
jgi:hypothetical protein